MQSHNTTQAGQGGPSDEVLLSEVRQGKLESFGVLYERYVSMARAVAYRHTENRTLSEDLASEAFARILQALKNGKGPRSFMGGYLATTIAHLAAENGLIAQKEILSEEYQLESFGSLDETVLKLHDSDELISAFTSLPERWQSILWMTEVENKKPREVASIMNLSANAVSALAVRARESLREGFLRAHQHAPQTVECSQYSPHLSSMVRGSLTKKRSESLRAHLSMCSACSAEYLNLIGINKTMRTWVFPVLAGLTPILTDSSKIFLPYLAGGSVAAMGSRQGGFSGLNGSITGRWIPKNQSLMGAAAVVTAVGAVAGGIALVNHSAPNSTVISADSQLEAAPAPVVSVGAGEVSDTLVDSSQSQTASMSAEPFRAPSAATPNMTVAPETFDTVVPSVGNSSRLSSLSQANSKNSNVLSGGTSINASNSGIASDGRATQYQKSSPAADTHYSVSNSGNEASDNSMQSVLPAVPSTPEPEIVPNPQPSNPSEPPVERSLPGDPVEPNDPVDPAQPVDPVNPTDPVDPAEPTDPAQPADPVTPTNPADPTDPVDPVTPTNPADPTDPVDPAEPTDPAQPVDPVTPTNPADPTDPADPGVLDPKDWVGTPDYYAWMAQVPWDTIGSSVGGNRMCTITYIESDSLVSFGTYIPPIILDSHYVFYVLESYFGLEAITQITCV